MKNHPCRRPLLTALLGACVVFVPAFVHAADWQQWRGPNFDGSSDAKDLPATFGKTENVLWSAALPGPGNSTPIIAGDRIFLTAVEAGSKKLLALCLNRSDGKALWQNDVGVGFKEKGENSMATPSPVTDGKSVWFLYGTGDLAAFDLDGKPLWSRNLQKDHGAFNIQWLYGSSPLLYKGKLYVQVLQRDRTNSDSGIPGAAKYDGPAPSYLLAIDPVTGKDLWKQVRPDNAVGETKESYATPTPHETPERSEIVVIGGDCVTGHDPETGKELWRFTGWNPQKINHWRTVPSVAVGDGLVFACAPKGGPVMAIREGGQGDISESHKAWSTRSFTSDVCAPLFYRDRLYILDTGSKKLSCADPKTGEVKWATPLGGGAVFRASPTGADGKIYCLNVNGDAWVVSAEDGKVLHQTALGGKGSRGSVAVADGTVLVRAGETLYAFGKK